MDADPSLARDVSTDDGYIPGVFSVLDHANYNDTGYAIRQDLLDKLNLEVPETYDQLHDVLTALTNAGYGGLALGSSGVSIQNNLLSGFGVYGEYSSVMGVNYPIYVDHGEVKFGLIEPGFQKYLETMSQWYSEGLIYSDFISQGSGMSTDTNLIFNDQVSVFYSEAAQLPVTETSGKSLIDGFAISPMPMTLQEVGSTEYYSTYPSHTENSWSVAANSEVLYQVLELFNFMYSDEGSLICNYGEENVSYVVNDDGSFSFTDAVLNHEMGMRMGMMVYVMMGGPYKADVMRMINAYEPLAYSASVDYWTPEATDITSIPGGVSLTADESSQVANILGDVLTYAGTMVTKYIMGDENIANFQEFTNTMESMNVKDAVAIYQTAYDRYLEK
jgi:putative aldouronate transport system substrate-binding protein